MLGNCESTTYSGIAIGKVRNLQLKQEFSFRQWHCCLTQQIKFTRERPQSHTNTKSESIKALRLPPGVLYYLCKWYFICYAIALYFKLMSPKKKHADYCSRAGPMCSESYIFRLDCEMEQNNTNNIKAFSHISALVSPCGPQDGCPACWSTWATTVTSWASWQGPPALIMTTWPSLKGRVISHATRRMQTAKRTGSTIR